MNKQQIRTDTLRQLEDLVRSRIERVGPVMDDYDGGQKAAYDNVISDINAYKAIIRHTSSSSGHKEPGCDYGIGG